MLVRTFDFIPVDGIKSEIYVGKDLGCKFTELSYLGGMGSKIRFRQT